MSTTTLPNPRTQLHALQLNSLPPQSQQDPSEYTARPGGRRSSISWNNTGSSSSSHSIDPIPGLPRGLSRPLTQAEQDKLAHLDRLKFFLATAPSRWDTSSTSSDPSSSTSANDPYLNMGITGLNASAFGSAGTGLGGHHHPHAPSHPALNRFLLPNQEFVTCVLWNGLYHITGTDIVRALVFRFEAFGRPVKNMKKFEEGVFSDLRNLKPGQDASLEEPKSPFLDLLFKYQCIRTQKKQKVFYWFSVPHDRLFLDALERDLKREKMGLEPTTQITGEPARSFVYDGAFKRSLYEQFVKAAGGRDGEGELERVVRGLEESEAEDSQESTTNNHTNSEGENMSMSEDEVSGSDAEKKAQPKASESPFFNMFSLFEGSPTYKQRRKKVNRPSALSSVSVSGAVGSSVAVQGGGGVGGGEDERGRYPYRVTPGQQGYGQGQGQGSVSVDSAERFAYPYTGSGAGGAQGQGRSYTQQQQQQSQFGYDQSQTQMGMMGYASAGLASNTNPNPNPNANAMGMNLGMGMGMGIQGTSMGIQVDEMMYPNSSSAGVGSFPPTHPTHTNTHPTHPTHPPHPHQSHHQSPYGYPPFRIKQEPSDPERERERGREPVSAADMFLRQARGELSSGSSGSGAGAGPGERVLKRHSYGGATTTGAMGMGVTGMGGTGMDVPVWVEGRFAGVGPATGTSMGMVRGRSVDGRGGRGEEDDVEREGSAGESGSGSDGEVGLGVNGIGMGVNGNGESPGGSSPSSNSASSTAPPTSSTSTTLPTSTSTSTSAPTSASSTTTPTTAATTPGTPSTSTKAYACPLFSCGRLFKRMEHLKRHLRTHTMERPFVCTREGCGKRFSRSDNLGQHLRVCRRGSAGAAGGNGLVSASAGAANTTTTTAMTNGSVNGTGMGGIEWGASVADWINSSNSNSNSNSEDESEERRSGSEDESGAASASASASRGRDRKGGDISVGLGMFGGEDGVGMGMGMGMGMNMGMNMGMVDTSAPAQGYFASQAQAQAQANGSGAGVGAGVQTGGLDVPMELCEVELTGEVREVQGDEEGLVRVHVRGGSGSGGDERFGSMQQGQEDMDVYEGQHLETYPHMQRPDTAGSTYSSSSSHGQPFYTGAGAGAGYGATQTQGPSGQGSGQPNPDSTSSQSQSQWALRATPSPAFSTISVPSLPSTSPNRASWSGASGIPRPHSSYMRQHSHSGHSSSGGSVYGDEGYESFAGGVPIPRNSTHTSMGMGMSTGMGAGAGMGGGGGGGGGYGMMPSVSVSAPSHKLAFDHGSLYPPGMLLEPSSTVSQGQFGGSSGGGGLGLSLSLDSNSSGGSLSASGSTSGSLSSSFGSTGGGPVRRHRSMTPSLMRGADGGVVRRPGTAGVGVGGGFGFGGSVEFTGGQYHPHPYATASSSRASSLSRGGGGSVHSSPAGGHHHLSLAPHGVGPHGHGHMQRSESRASSLSVEIGASGNGTEQVQEQMRQMMHGSRPGSVAPPSGDTTSGPGSVYGDVYRTDSPTPYAGATHGAMGMVTDSPATFAIDLPGQTHTHPHANHMHAATVPVQPYAMGNELGYGGVGQQNHNGAGYYPHHVSTI